MWRMMALVLAVGLVGTAAAENKDAKKAADKLDGSWTVMSITDHGKQLPLPPGSEPVLILKDGKYSLRVGNMEVENGTFKLDASKNPKEIETEAAAGEDKGKTDLGIYELKGDTLKTAFAGAGKKERPTSIDGEKYQVTVFTRAKK